MADHEKRNSPRARCSFACDVARGSESGGGTVLDISEGGLSLRTQLDLEQGDPIAVRMEASPRTELALEGIVWHVRKVRHQPSGEVCFVTGIMLSKAPEAYFDLLPREEPPAMQSPPEPRSVAEPAPQPEPEPKPAPPPPRAECRETPSEESTEESCGLDSFQVRLRARRGPRTRVLSLSASSLEEAESLAREELDADWDILEVSCR